MRKAMGGKNALLIYGFLKLWGVPLENSIPGMK
jgi:hypothetical protein